MSTELIIEAQVWPKVTGKEMIFRQIVELHYLNKYAAEPFGKNDHFIDYEVSKQ